MANRKPWSLEDSYRVVDAEGNEIAFCDGPASTEEDAEHAAEIVDKVNAHDELTAQLAEAQAQIEELFTVLASVRSDVEDNQEDFDGLACIAVNEAENMRHAGRHRDAEGREEEAREFEAGADECGKRLAAVDALLAKRAAR